MRSIRCTRVIVGLSVSVMAVGGFAASASATSGQLGGLDLAGYCQSLGDNGTTAIGPATLSRNAITGPNFAYQNWACVQDSGALVPINPIGPAPSMLDACRSQYPGVASYSFPTSADDAYTWNCYSLPPAAGPGHQQQLAAATSALLGNDAVQAEIATLQGLISSRHPLQALVSEATFLSSRSTTELVSDVLGAYGLTSRVDQASVTLQLAAAITRAALNLP